MSRRSMKGPAWAVLLLTTAILMAVPGAAIAGPGEAGRGHRTVTATGPDLVGIDYVVLVWYRRDDPLGSFQYQTYAVRKGEYTGAVDDWVQMMREKYPRYLVQVRRVDLNRERGATEKLRVGSVIHRELLMAAAQSGVLLGAPMRIGPGPSATQRPSTSARTWTEIPGAGGASNINPVAGTSPFPVPYPRPHP
jgi:hypothetical protein